MLTAAAYQQQYCQAVTCSNPHLPMHIKRLQQLKSHPGMHNLCTECIGPLYRCSTLQLLNTAAGRCVQHPSCQTHRPPSCRTHKPKQLFRTARPAVNRLQQGRQSYMLLCMHKPATGTKSRVL